jgi:hypothetical protein
MRPKGEKLLLTETDADEEEDAIQKPVIIQSSTKRFVASQACLNCCF